MQLIELSANQETFKKVRFNPTGLNLIIGQKSEGSSIKDTYNGVGKSLLIELINFCLGSSSKKAFEKVLPRWEFTLKFVVNGTHYTATRSTAKQGYIKLNEEAISLRKYTDFLGSKIFYLDQDINYLKFRGLVSFFVRKGKKGYASFRGSDDKPYATNLQLAYLLGLDYNRAIRKYELKTEIEKLDQSKKSFEENEILRSYYSDQSDIDIDLADLDEKIQKLETNLQQFQIAEDYHSIRREADSLSYKIKELANKEFSIKHALKNIEKSLQIEPDLDQEHIIRLYEEARLEVSDMIQRKLEETINFHNSLLAARTVRLNKERKKLQDKLQEIQITRRILGTKEENIIKYLDKKGALEEYTALNVQLSDFQKKRDKLTQYSKFLENFDQRKAELKENLATENLETERYLNSESGKLVKDRNLKIFQQLAKEFYTNKPSGISIHNNDGLNQTRYDIQARIQQDQSDGIDEVKIFCFDWLLLLSQHNHQMKTLVHDSRLFSNMDSRQQATALRVAKEYADKEGCQYIATFNANMLNGVKNELQQYNSEDIYKDIKKSIILELTDESESTKLLGITVDLDYEK